MSEPNTEINSHFARAKVISGEIITDFVNSNDQLANMITKFLKNSHIGHIWNKLDSYDVYALA